MVECLAAFEAIIIVILENFIVLQSKVNQKLIVNSILQICVSKDIIKLVEDVILFLLL